MIRNEAVECIDNFACLESLTSPDGLVPDELSTRIPKVRLAFPDLCHCGVGNISICQPKDELNVQQFSLFMGMKHGY